MNAGNCAGEYEERLKMASKKWLRYRKAVQSYAAGILGISSHGRSHIASAYRFHDGYGKESYGAIV